MIDFHHLCRICSGSNHAGHLIEYERTPCKGDRRAKRYQRIHIGRSMQQRFKAACKEILIDDQDHDRQQHLCERQAFMIVRKECGQRQSQHMMPHCKIHQHKQETD